MTFILGNSRIVLGSRSDAVASGDPVDAGVTPIDPTDLLLLEDQDARTLNATLSDGDPVLSWPSFNFGNRAGIVIGSNPIFRATGLGGVSESVQFAGATSVNWFDSRAETSWSLAILFQCLGEVDTYLLDRDSSSRFIVIPNFSVSGTAAIFDGANTTNLSVALDDGDVHLLVIACDGVAGTMDVWIDGVLDVSGAPYAASSWTNNVRLGSQFNSTSARWTGDLGFAYYFLDILTDEQAKGITEFVRQDRGLTL